MTHHLITRRGASLLHQFRDDAVSDQVSKQHALALQMAYQILRVLLSLGSLFGEFLS